MNHDPIRLSFHDATGRQLSWVEFRYDESGHLIEEAQVNDEVLAAGLSASLNPAQLDVMRQLFGVGQAAIRHTHLYDRQGRQAETFFSIGPLATDKKTITYNDCGDPVTEVSETHEFDYSLDEEGRLAQNATSDRSSRSEARFHYNYDDHGNWVLKTVEIRNDASSD